MTKLTSRYTKALEVAICLHGSNVRKGTTIPYVSHLLQVSGLVLEYGGTEDEAIAGLLHDAAEDAGEEVIFAESESEFGATIAAVLRGNRDSITDSKAEKAPSKERKLAYIASIAHKSESALLVSICDKIHNVRSLISDTQNLGQVHWNRFNASPEDSIWYYSDLAWAFESRQSGDSKGSRAVQTYSHLVNELRQIAFESTY